MIGEAVVSFNLTEDMIESYLQALMDGGVKKNATDKYRSSIKDLFLWLGNDNTITADRLKEWRKDVENRGYSKHTVQSYVATVNTFLRKSGYETLCIPKPPKNDLTDKRFGYLTALEATEKRNRKDVVWLCRCKCGKEVEVPATLLINMNTTSCGCLKTEKIQHSQRYVDNTSLTASLKDNPISARAVSGYTGVQPKRGKWVATIQYKKHLYYLGSFEKIEDAVKARARAKELVLKDAQRLYDETIDFFGEMPARPPKPKKSKIVEPKKDIITKAKRSDNTSGHTGVTKSYGKWVANITYKKKRYTLGAFDDLDEAIKTRKTAEQYIASNDIESLQRISTGCSSTEKQNNKNREEEGYGQAK